jgi:hypothetical protein
MFLDLGHVADVQLEAYAGAAAIHAHPLSVTPAPRVVCAHTGFSASKHLRARSGAMISVSVCWVSLPKSQLGRTETEAEPANLASDRAEIQGPERTLIWFRALTVSEVSVRFRGGRVHKWVEWSKEINRRVLVEPDWCEGGVWVVRFGAQTAGKVESAAQSDVGAL